MFNPDYRFKRCRRIGFRGHRTYEFDYMYAKKIGAAIGERLAGSSINYVAVDANRDHLCRYWGEMNYGAQKCFKKELESAMRTAYIVKKKISWEGSQKLRFVYKSVKVDSRKYRHFFLFNPGFNVLEMLDLLKTLDCMERNLGGRNGNY